MATNWPLHGYSHLDTEAASGGLRARFLRNVYTQREGEFAALTEAEANRRLDLGLAWFAARGWTPSGFVPPAWLLGEGAWRALRAGPFDYTTTFSHFHCLRAVADRAGQRACAHVIGKMSEDARGQMSEQMSEHVIEHMSERVSMPPLLSPSMVYAARNRSGRLLSPRVADATAAMLARAPLVRFSLHPPDVRYPDLVRHTQQVIERLLVRRDAVTKAECARRLTRSAATSLHSHTSADRHHRSSPASNSG